MLFLHPMWDSESQRLGLRRCTPAGYRYHGIAELVGFAGLLLLLAMLGWLAWRWWNGSFRPAYLWFLGAPFAMGVASECLMQHAWRLARRKDFRYDAQKREASWQEDGTRRTYRFGQTE